MIVQLIAFSVVMLVVFVIGVFFFRAGACVVAFSKSFVKASIGPSIKEGLEKRQRIYNDLPELGKARVDRNREMWGKVFIVAFCTLFVVGTSYISPLGPLPGLTVVLYWAHRNWK